MYTYFLLLLKTLRGHTSEHFVQSSNFSLKTGCEPARFVYYGTSRSVVEFAVSLLDLFYGNVK